MIRNLRFSAVFAALLVVAVSSSGQDSPTARAASGAPLAGTVIDVDSGRNRLQLQADDDPASRITVETDAVATEYYGFGTVIAGKPEIFIGSQGFSNLRIGDRVEIRGSARANGLLGATRVTLLGRDVAAAPVGVGQTRPVTSASTPTDTRPSVTSAAASVYEGTIRQINSDEGRIVIETTQRRLLNIRTYRTTPVYYRGDSYRVSNLEVGDRVRIEVDPRDVQNDQITARRIDVTRSVQEGTAPGTGNGGVVTMLEGQVTRTDATADYAYVDDGKGEVRIDMAQAADDRGEALHARDLQVGDHVEISGSFAREGDLFLASTVRFTTTGNGDRTGDRGNLPGRYSVVTISGTVTETLDDAPTVSVRDRETNRIVRFWMADDLVVRTKGLSYTSASTLRVNDTVVVKAFRDASGNLIAQTVRLRNR